MTKRILFALLFATHVTQLVAWINRKKVTILCYHSVTKQTEPIPDDTHKLNLCLDSFRDQIDYLQAHYKIISLSEFINARRKNLKLPANAAVLTFDDGVRNFRTVVAPLLLERSIPATSFIVTGENYTRETSASNGTWDPEDDENCLTWSDVRQLEELGFEFGSHTCTHLSLPDIAAAEVRSELEGSLNALKSNLRRSIFPLCYPHGRTTESISRLSQEIGYSCGLTSVLGQNGVDSDLFALKRTVIASDDDLPTFAARVSGFTLWCNRLTDLIVNRASTGQDVSVVSYESLLPDECAPNKTF